MLMAGAGVTYAELADLMLKCSMMSLTCVHDMISICCMCITHLVHSLMQSTCMESMQLQRLQFQLILTNIGHILCTHALESHQMGTSH